MNPRTIKTTAMIAAVAISAVGCQNMTPGENAAVFGAVGGIAAGTLARAAGMSTAQSLATGAAVGAVIGATAYVIATHQASERQRKIAEANARVYYGRVAASKKPHKSRYIAVDTANDSRTSAKAKKSVMIWDTQSQQVVGNNVYDVQSTPRVGSTAKFETYNAEYVGSGS